MSTTVKLDDVREFFLTCGGPRVYVGLPPAGTDYPSAGGDERLICLHELNRKREPHQTGFSGGWLSVQVDVWHRYQAEAEETRGDLIDEATRQDRMPDGAMSRWSDHLGVRVKDVRIDREYSRRYSPDDGGDQGFWSYSFDMKIFY